MGTRYNLEIIRALQQRLYALEDNLVVISEKNCIGMSGSLNAIPAYPRPAHAHSHVDAAFVVYLAQQRISAPVGQPGHARRVSWAAVTSRGRGSCGRVPSTPERASAAEALGTMRGVSRAAVARDRGPDECRGHGSPVARRLHRVVTPELPEQLTPHVPGALLAVVSEAPIMGWGSRHVETI